MISSFLILWGGFLVLMGIYLTHRLYTMLKASFNSKDETQGVSKQ